MADSVAVNFAALRRTGKHGSPYDSDFFRKLIELQNEVQALQKECETLKEDAKRRQASYLRREAKLQQTIDELNKRQERIASGPDVDEDIEAAIVQYKEKMKQGLNALLQKQQMQIGLSSIERLEYFDERLKSFEASFAQRTGHCNAHESVQVAWNKKGMEAVEELTALRKSHASLQQKYKEECAKNECLKVEQACLAEREALLAKQLVILKQECIINGTNLSK